MAQEMEDTTIIDTIIMNMITKTIIIEDMEEDRIKNIKISKRVLKCTQCQGLNKKERD